MNKTGCFAFVLLALTCPSCISIYFTEPQTIGGKELFEFPDKLHGVWKESDNVISIKNGGIYESRVANDSLPGKAVIIDQGPKFMDDNFRLFQINNYFILNEKSNDSPWRIHVFEVKKNKDILIYSSVDPELFTKDRHLRLGEAHYIVDGVETISNRINPEFESQLEFKSATFSGQMSLKTIKRIAKPENLRMILKCDGSIWYKSA